MGWDEEKPGENRLKEGKIEEVSGRWGYESFKSKLYVFGWVFYIHILQLKNSPLSISDFSKSLVVSHHDLSIPHEPCRLHLAQGEIHHITLVH